MVKEKTLEHKPIEWEARVRANLKTLSLEPGDITEAVGVYEMKTGDKPKAIGLHPGNAGLEQEAEVLGIPVIHPDGMLAWEVWLFSNLGRRSYSRNRPMRQGEGERTLPNTSLDSGTPVKEKTPEGEPIRWSEDSLVMFSDGYAWTSLMLDCPVKQICLGKEDEAKAVLSGAEPIGQNFTDRQAAALTRILELREETNGGDTGSGGLERSRAVRTFGNRPKDTRLFTARKRVPRSTPHHPKTGVSHR